MTTTPDSRGRLLRALGFVTLRNRYLDSWRGVSAIAAGMAHQDFDFQLTRYAERGWRANFYPPAPAPARS